MNYKDDKVWDVMVIGGGASGMMAAATAAADGAKVLLLEKNATLGKKLLITGGGRCNVTNNKPVVRDMLSQYKTEGKFLFSAFMQHGVAESIDWFTKRSVPLKEENEGRLFPQTESAKTVWQALVNELKQHNVQVVSQTEVTGLKKVNDIWQVTSKDGTVYEAKSCILATGGIARPETGSTGDGFKLLKKLGHTIIPNNYALVPLTLKNTWIKQLSGITLPNVKITLRSEDKKHSVHKGKLLFTHVGVTGPTILNMSSTVGELLSYGPVTLLLDLVPDKDAGEFKQHLKNLLSENSNKKLRNTLGQDIPTKVVKVVLEVLGIDGDTPGHSVSTADRTKLLKYLKAVPLEVEGLLGSDKAVISAGGVDLTQIDFKTMESKLHSGLYAVGDLLNINRPSGGYSLQLCWTTGAVAGTQAVKRN